MKEDGPLRLGILASMVLLWLAGYWFMSDGWWHRRLLWWTVFPAALLQLPDLWTTLRGHRWLPLVGALLLYQILSRFWAEPPLMPAGALRDTAGVALLLVTLAHLARRLPSFTRILPAVLATTSSITALASIYLYYSSHSLADDRLRNVFVYSTGLNPVLTGLLCAFGSLCAMSLLVQSAPRSTRLHLWQACMGVQIFALFATQSRTAMVALGIGLLIFLYFERPRMASLLIPTALAAALFFTLLLTTPDGGAAMGDLVQRGTTGRLDIYRSFLGEMTGRDFLVGKGMGTRAELEEDVLGWHVAHPHNSYLTQLYLTGILGSVLLALILFRAGWQSFLSARNHHPFWLALLAGHGIALVVDGGRIFSLASIARIEFLLLAVPAILVTSPGIPERPRRSESYEKALEENPTASSHPTS